MRRMIGNRSFASTFRGNSETSNATPITRPKVSDGEEMRVAAETDGTAVRYPDEPHAVDAMNETLVGNRPDLNQAGLATLLTEIKEMQASHKKHLASQREEIDRLREEVHRLKCCSPEYLRERNRFISTYKHDILDNAHADTTTATGNNVSQKFHQSFEKVVKILEKNGGDMGNPDGLADARKEFWDCYSEYMNTINTD